MKARVALLASLFSLCLVAAVAAQVSTITGTVVSNSGGVLVLDTDSGQRSFMVDAQSSLPADLAAGTRVTVEYHTLANDKFHAFKVTPSSATAPSTTTDTAPAETTMAPPADPNAAAPATAAPTMAAPPPAAPAAPTTTTTTTQTPPANTMDNTTAADTTTPATDETGSTTGNRLPATASPLPLLALAGSLALAGGLLLRRRRA
jgi:hypothetical protein